MNGDKKTDEKTKTPAAVTHTEPTSTVAKKEKKFRFSHFIRERELTPARVTVLTLRTGWTEETEITESEYDAAFRKYLRNK